MLLVIFFSLLVIAQTILPPTFFEQLITMLTPIFTAIAIWVVAKLKTVQGFTGFIINFAFVPLCSAIVVFLSNLLMNPTMRWWEQLVYGLASAWVAQFIIQWNKRVEDSKAGGFKVTKERLGS